MPKHRLICLLFYLLVPHIFSMYQQQRPSTRRNQPAVGYDIPQPADIFNIPAGVQLQPGITWKVNNDDNYLINLMPNGGMMVLRNGQFWEKSVGGGIYHKDLHGNPYKKGPDGKFYPLNLPPAPQQFYSVHNQVHMTQNQQHQHQHNHQQPAGGNVGPTLRSHSISQQQQRLATAGIHLPTGIFNIPNGIQYGVTQKVNNDDNYLINVMPNGGGMMVLRNGQFWEKSMGGGIYHKDLNGVPYKMEKDGKFYPLNLPPIPSQQFQPQEPRTPTLSASKLFGNAHGVAGQTKISQGTSSNFQQQQQSPVANIPIGVHTVQPTINNNFKTGRLSTTQIAQQRQTSTLRNKTISNTIPQNGTTCRGKNVQFAATVGSETFRRFDDRNHEASTSRAAICRFGSYITRSQAYDYLRTFVKYFKPPFDEDHEKVMSKMNREQSVQFIGDYRGGFLWPFWISENQIFQHLRDEFCYLDDCAQLKSDSKNAIYAWTLFTLTADLLNSMKNENPWACVHHADCMIEDSKIIDMLTENRKYSIGELKRNCQKIANKIKQSLSSKNIQQHLTKRNPAMYHCKNILTPNPNW